MVNLVSPKIVIDTSIGYCHVFVVHRVDLSSRSACRPIYSTLSQQQQRRLWVLTETEAERYKRSQESRKQSAASLASPNKDHAATDKTSQRLGCVALIHAVHICPIGYDFGQARMRIVLTSVAIFSSVGKQIVARLSLTITKD